MARQTKAKGRAKVAASAAVQFSIRAELRDPVRNPTEVSYLVYPTEGPQDSASLYRYWIKHQSFNSDDAPTAVTPSPLQKGVWYPTVSEADNTITGEGDAQFFAFGAYSVGYVYDRETGEAVSEHLRHTVGIPG
jgi:hypothetical protein